MKDLRGLINTTEDEIIGLQRRIERYRAILLEENISRTVGTPETELARLLAERIEEFNLKVSYLQGKRDGYRYLLEEQEKKK